MNRFVSNSSSRAKPQWREGGGQPVLQYLVYIDVAAVFINECTPHTVHYKGLLIKELRTKEKPITQF